MSDTSEFGGLPRPPRWVWAIAAVAVGAVLAGEIAAHIGPHRAAASSPVKSPAAAASPFRGSHTPVATSAGRWPSAPDACGSPFLPQIHLALAWQDVGVQARLLVGGTAVWQVTPGGIVSHPLPGLPDHGRLVTQLAAAPGAAYALIAGCSNSSESGSVYRVVAGAAHRLGVAADTLLGGPHHGWAVTYGKHAVLTPLEGGPAVILPAAASPVADTPAGLVVVAYDVRAAWPYTVELINPKTGAPVRRLAQGFPLGASGHVALVSLPDCGGPPTHSACTLESIDLATGRVAARFALPPGRSPDSDAVFSPRGTLAAFQLARARPDPHFTTEGPPLPADVAVLDLHTGGLDVVPGLELPPNTHAGLAFSATGSWLLVTVNEAEYGELLAWRPGMPGPVLVTTLPGPLAAAPPLLPALPSPRNGQHGRFRPGHAR